MRNSCLRIKRILCSILLLVCSTIGSSTSSRGLAASAPVTATFQISNPSDDVNEVNGTLETFSTPMWIGNGGSASASFTGLRFRNVSIPQGATITAAWLEVHSAQSQWVSLDFEMSAEATGNSAAFSAANPPSVRSRVGAVVNHASNTSWNEATWYQLDDLSPVVQAVVNRPDWLSGHSLAIIVNGTGGTWSRKYIDSMDQATSVAPKLVVTYEGGADPPPPPPPPPSTGFLNEVIVEGLPEPTSIAFTPDGRMLIAERGGRIRLVRPGSVEIEPTPFLDLDNVESIVGERGLVGLTLDPSFAANGYYYLLYTSLSPLRDRVSRFTAVGNTTDPATEFILWEDTDQSSDIHHGGGLRVGPDGCLYLAIGDHHSTDPGTSHASQRLDKYHGKILRINRDGTIPSSNPFFDGPGPNLDAIWARGLRNPFRIHFDSQTGALYINDVGGGGFEEVNAGIAGANYGWPLCEGSCTNIAGVTSPIFSYPHAGRDAAITGGVMYRGTMFPAEYVGSYFYADYVQNWIRRLTFDDSGAVSGSSPFEPPDGGEDDSVGAPVDLAVGLDGSLYYVDIWGGVRRISYQSGSGDQTPEITSTTVSPTQGLAPLTITYSGIATDAEGGSLSFTWTFGDGSSASGQSGTHTYSISGQYSVRLTVSDGTNETHSTPITVTVGTPPSGLITSPANGLVFRAGDLITFSGSGTDDQPLGPSNFSWMIWFHHETHTHPALGPVSGTSGTFTIPTVGHDFSGNTSYEIKLTVTDQSGISATESVFIYPQKVNLTIATRLGGLTVSLDQATAASPLFRDTLVGFQHQLSAPLVQTVGNTVFEFVSWSDGGAASHMINVPGADAEFTATYVKRGTVQPRSFSGPMVTPPRR